MKPAAQKKIKPVALLYDIRKSVSEILNKPFSERINHQVFQPDKKALALWAIDCAERVLPYFEEKYPSDEWGILDVCLIGHWDDVPIRTCSQYYYGYGPPDSDFYYAELTKPDSQSWDANGNHLWAEDSDPIDFVSEVTVGRIPWSNPTIVEDICLHSKTQDHPL